MAMNPMAGMGRPPAMGGTPPSMGVAPMGQAPSPQMGGGIAPSTGNVMQITSTLRGMSDQQLQQYAAMHKSDPFVFPLAFQESQTRQQIRAGSLAQRMGQKPPPVVDQDLAQMAPTPITGGAGQTITGGHGQAINVLPEEQGIGALNAPNLQNMADGGIAGYADGGQQPGMFNYAQMAPAVDLHPNSGVTPRSMAAGGIAHFAEEGAVKAKPDYRQMMIDSAIANGVDPKVMQMIAGVEGTGKNPKSSATNFFQFIDKTYKDLGGDPALRHDPSEAIRLGGLYLGKNQKALEKSLGRVPEPHELYGAHFLGEPVGKALLTANPKQTVAEFLKNTTPKRADEIIKANPEVLGSKGEKTVGDVRNWTKLKMAGLGLPAANAGELPRNEWEDNTQQTAGLPSLRQNQNPGYTPQGVEAIGQRLDQAREELKNMRGHGFLQQRKDPNATVNYQNAQDLVSNLQRTYEEGMAAAHPELTKAAMIGNPANPQGGMRVLPAPAQYSQEVAKEVARPDIAAQMGKETPNYSATTEAEDASFMPTAANKQPPTPDLSSILNPSTTNETPKTGTEAKGGRDWNSFLLNMGLGLLAGKSQYALQNAGEAGLGAVKMEQEQRKQDAAERLQEAQGKYYGAYATAIEHGAKEKNLQLEAEKIIQSTLDKNKLLSFDPEARAAAEAKLRQSIYQNLGIRPIMASGNPQLGKPDLDLISKYLG